MSGKRKLDFKDLLLVIGCGVMGYGVWMINPAAMFVVAGAGLILVAVRG